MGQPDTHDADYVQHNGDAVRPALNPCAKADIRKNKASILLRMKSTYSIDSNFSQELVKFGKAAASIEAEWQPVLGCFHRMHALLHKLLR